MDEFHGEGDDGFVEELCFVDADDFELGQAGVEGFAEARDGLVLDVTVVTEVNGHRHVQWVAGHILLVSHRGTAITLDDRGCQNGSDWKACLCFCRTIFCSQRTKTDILGITSAEANSGCLHFL